MGRSKPTPAKRNLEKEEQNVEVLGDQVLGRVVQEESVEAIFEKEVALEAAAEGSGNSDSDDSFLNSRKRAERFQGKKKDTFESPAGFTAPPRATDVLKERLGQYFSAHNFSSAASEGAARKRLIRKKHQDNNSLKKRSKRRLSIHDLSDASSSDEDGDLGFAGPLTVTTPPAPAAASVKQKRLMALMDSSDEESEDQRDECAKKLDAPNAAGTVSPTRRRTEPAIVTPAPSVLNLSHRNSQMEPVSAIKTPTETKTSLKKSVRFADTPDIMPTPMVEYDELEEAKRSQPKKRPRLKAATRRRTRSMSLEDGVHKHIINPFMESKKRKSPSPADSRVPKPKSPPRKKKPPPKETKEKNIVVRRIKQPGSAKDCNSVCANTDHVKIYMWQSMLTEDKDRVPEEDYLQLRFWVLQHTSIDCVDFELQKDHDELFIQSPSASLTILDHCKAASSSKSTVEPSPFVDHSSTFVPVSKGILSRALVMTIKERSTGGSESSGAPESQVEVRLFLLKSLAFLYATPSFISPYSSKIRIRKEYEKQAPTPLIQASLGVLFPGSIFSDALPSFLPVASEPSSTDALTPKQLYALVDNVQYNATLDVNGEPLLGSTIEKIPGLVPTLRPYQQAAVRWMLRREGCFVSMEGDKISTKIIDLPESKEWQLAWWVISATDPDIPGKSINFVPLTEHLKTPEECRKEPVCYCCPFVGWWAKTYNEARSFALGESVGQLSESGGILAESMGLGKSVEVISCILANPASEEGSLSSIYKEDASSEDIHKEDETQEFERWMEVDEDIIGICICGDQVLFHQCENRPFLVCQSCNEPMHESCAGPNPKRIDESPSKLERFPRIVYKRLFKNDSASARVCSPARCPCCVAEKHRAIIAGEAPNLMRSKATLIITPNSILHQWKREIERHTAIRDIVTRAGKEEPVTRPLKVVIYPGIQRLSNFSRTKAPDDISFQSIHPAHLASADVVLMTFDALRGDLGHSDDAPYQPDLADSLRSIRGRKKYRIIPSPLLAIKWFRVCLDEAQRVETTTAASAKMALKLEANHRWCISGTPVGKGKLEDLYGLLLFLRIKPFDEKKWFSICIDERKSGIKDRMVTLLKDLFWRSTKASDIVREQMGVPKQVEKKIILKLSSIERHFYQRQLEETMNAVGDISAASKKKINRKGGRTKRDDKQLERLSNQLQRLRAACCHPQVGAGRLRVAKTKQSSNEFSRFLTMDQILDRLMDDAKLKCEESQRLALMHGNAMAAISRLKMQAKARGITIVESDASLLMKSYNQYMESMKLAESNSTPSSCIGEAKITGCNGFQSTDRTVRNGIFSVDWLITCHHEQGDEPIRELWSRVDFSGPAKKLTQIQVQAVSKIPLHIQNSSSADASFTMLTPKDCILQVGNAALGGSFVDVATFQLAKDSESWSIVEGFRTNKSKSWRIVIQSYHNGKIGMSKTGPTTFYAGLNVKMLEADVASDSTQRLHALHNAAKSLSLLKDTQSIGEEGENEMSGEDVGGLIESMESEAKEIEKLYVESKFPIHNESQRQLEQAISIRWKTEQKLFGLTDRLMEVEAGEKDAFDDEWWNDVLVSCSILGSPQEQVGVVQKVHEDLGSAYEGAYDRNDLRKKPFPPFQDVRGLVQALALRMGHMRSNVPSGGFASCTENFRNFSTCPDQAVVIESSTCNRCKKDWSWTGPMCRLCKLSVRLEKMSFDRLLLLVLKSIYDWMKGNKSSQEFKEARSNTKVDDRANIFFQLIEEYSKERSAAENAWRVHMELLNDLDELNMCKQAMRLTIDGEDLTALTEAELNAVVHPIDVTAKYLENDMKQAVSLANLRRHKSTLRYLKNQNEERAKESEKKECADCAVCLSPLEDSRAVLKCGHAFHRTPCIDRLVARSGHRTVSCPMRCAIKTEVSEIMIAEDKRHDDGTTVSREVAGSWGTKVTQIVSDILEMENSGEKGIVFSQWEDMLDVVQEALATNKVKFTRATSANSIASSVKRFRSGECPIFLLNVKNGAEGLTLTEATHVFMVEPLLNCGQDSQAINRIHRIGQTRQTVVHRYIVEETIEVKIDQLRMQRQEDDDFEDAGVLGRNAPANIKAGGIDGGFSTQEELLDVLKLD